jgi:formate dehydrogenase assembly factor FdhD
VALPDVGRQHAVDQVAGRLAHSLAVRVGRTAGYWTSTVRNGEDI